MNHHSTNHYELGGDTPEKKKGKSSGRNIVQDGAP